MERIFVTRGALFRVRTGTSVGGSYRSGTKADREFQANAFGAQRENVSPYLAYLSSGVWMKTEGLSPS